MTVRPALIWIIRMNATRLGGIVASSSPGLNFRATTLSQPRELKPEVDRTELESAFWESNSRVLPVAPPAHFWIISYDHETSTENLANTLKNVNYRLSRVVSPLLPQRRSAPFPCDAYPRCAHPVLPSRQRKLVYFLEVFVYP